MKVVTFGLIAVPDEGNGYGTLYIGDPCYFPYEDFSDLWLTVRVRAGEWLVSQCYTDDSRTPTAFGIKSQRIVPSFWSASSHTVLGVDSGQMAFMTKPLIEAHRADKDAFYDQICDLTKTSYFGGTVQGMGAVSATNYGDGSYPAHCLRDTFGSGDIFGVLVDFVPGEKDGS